MDQVNMVADTLSQAHQETAKARQEAEQYKAQWIEKKKEAKFFQNQAKQRNEKSK